MKICILGDCHLGSRNDSLVFHAFFEKFYIEFFKTLEERGVNTIIQLGDLWDRRKYVNFSTLAAARKYFFDELKSRDIKLITLLGNHDTSFKNTLEVNSSSLLLKEYANIEVHSVPTTIEIDSTKIALIPWICADNYDECFNEISTTQAEICMGHFEIAGFEMHRGQRRDDGISPTLFDKFDLVYSGHYHHRSTIGSISYLGTPYEMTWHDYNDPKGFHLFDLDTRELEFIQNPYTIFVRLEYNDKNQEPIDLRAFDLKDTYVKLVVVNKTDYYKFDSFVTLLYSKGCHDIKIVEDMSEFQSGGLEETINLEDTQSILSNYIDSIQTDLDKEKIKSFMKMLYVEAIARETL